jgi:type IV secretion system protein VirB6
MAIEVYQAMGSHLQDATEFFANKHSAAIAELFRPAVYVGVVFWWTLMGYQALAGKLQEPFSQALWRAACIAFLAGLAYEPSIYQVQILGMYDELQNELVSTIAGTQTTPYKIADDMLEKTINLGSDTSTTILSLDPETWLSAGVSAWMVWLGGLFITAESAGNIMGAKAALAIVLALGQFAILCAIFPATRKIFDTFIEITTGYVGKIALLAATMGFSLELLAGALNHYNVSQVLYFPLILLINVVVGFKLVREMDGVAAKIFGGITSVVGNPITAAANIATAPASAAARYLRQSATRTNASTGHRETSSRLSHMIRGNTLANPAYRQKVRENMRSGWGAANGGSAREGGASAGPRSGMTAGEKVRAAAARYQERNQKR